LFVRDLERRLRKNNPMLSIHFVWAWLAAWHAVLPYAVLGLAIFEVVHFWRKWHPRSWLWLESRLPFAEELNAAEELAHNIVIGLPIALVTAAAAALLSGGGVGAAVAGAVVGAALPLLHHIRKALPFDPYRGALGAVRKPAPRSPLLPILLLLCASLGVSSSACGLLAESQAKSVVPCDSRDHEAQAKLLAKGADCRARVLACNKAEDPAACKTPIIKECDAFDVELCEESK
jgi:hypothetical protein